MTAYLNELPIVFSLPSAHRGEFLRKYLSERNMTIDLTCKYAHMYMMAPITL